MYRGVCCTMILLLNLEMQLRRIGTSHIFEVIEETYAWKSTSLDLNYSALHGFHGVHSV
jgi:hypothetical protein